MAALIGTGWLVMATPSNARAGECSNRIAYPGDDAGQSATALWMAHGARARGLPGELPVMAALVESGLRNLSGGDRDAVGFFQMRLGIWTQGQYAGYPDHPGLQLKWFGDQAISVRDRHIVDGEADFGGDPNGWGDWIADVERPPEQFRGRYQLRLGEARDLIGRACRGYAPDHIAPRTAIDAVSVDSAQGKATLAFHATDPAPASLPLRFRCKLDERTFRSCGSPKTYARLRPGRHTVAVRATDAAGNADRSPAQVSFRITRG